MAFWIWGTAMAVLAAIAVPVTAVSIHQTRRRRYEKAAAFRKKQKIQL
ncbi:MAG: hypothetical protein ACK40O_01120 [Allosphingosinicella sp.]